MTPEEIRQMELERNLLLEIHKERQAERRLIKTPGAVTLSAWLEEAKTENERLREELERVNLQINAKEEAIRQLLRIIESHRATQPTDPEFLKIVSDAERVVLEKQKRDEVACPGCGATAMCACSGTR